MALEMTTHREVLDMAHNRRTIVLPILAPLLLFLFGCSSSFSGEIRGQILNIQDIKPYIGDQSFLQLVAVPENGNFTFLAIGDGGMVYGSDLQKIPMPLDGKFRFIVKDLRSGKYLVAAQQLSKEFKYFGPLLWSKDKTRAIVVVVEASSASNPTIDIPAGVIFSKVGVIDREGGAGQGIVPPATPAPAGAATSMNSEMEQFWRGVEGGWIVTENPSERGKLFVHRSKSANALVDLIYLVKVETNGSWTVYKPTRTSSGSDFGRRLGSGDAPRSVSVGLCGCR
jgi:hypothetical protein